MRVAAAVGREKVMVAAREAREAMGEMGLYPQAQWEEVVERGKAAMAA